jgi:hypothetical protein
MKEWSIENSNIPSSTLELGSSLVCIADATKNSSKTSMSHREDLNFESRITEDD